MLPDALAQAAERLRAGLPILLFDSDGREGEVDLFFAAAHATPRAIAELRREAGGLVFLAVDPRVGEALELPFLQDVFEEASGRFPVLREARVNDLRYDARSSFSLPVNHRDTFTGITDEDRSLTVRSFEALSREALAGAFSAGGGAREFGRRFRAPGHVHVCVGAPRLLDDREGHTELAVALARLSGVTPVLVGAEMLGDGRALGREEAAAYAAKRGTVLVDGATVLSGWQSFKAATPLAV